MDRDHITSRRQRLFSVAVHRIGVEESESGGNRLRLEAIPAYLHRIGCPLELPPPLELSALPVTLRRDVAAAAAEMRLSRAGFLFYSGIENYPAAVTYAAVIATEFLRRRRCVAWHSAEEIFTAAPRRVTTTEEDADTNDLFFDLSQVYELLIVGGIQAYGHTDYEQRTLVKVLSERMTWMLPTVLLASSMYNEGGDSPLIDFISANYAMYDEFV
jgi:hypothetical protein